MRNLTWIGHRQRGVAALFVAVMLLIGVTLIILFAAKVGVLEQNISANDYRARESLASAETAMGQASEFLEMNKDQIPNWSTAWPGTATGQCSGSDTALPCSAIDAATQANYKYFTDVPVGAILEGRDAGVVGDEPDVAAHFLIEWPAGGEAENQYTIVATGTSDDKTAEAIVSQDYIFRNTFESDMLKIPLVAAGEIGGNGGINVLPNENAGGPGVPLSAWSADDTFVSGNARTCHVGDFLSNYSTGGPEDICVDSEGNAGICGGIYTNFVYTKCLTCNCPAKCYNGSVAAGNCEKNTDVETCPLSEECQEGIDVLDYAGPFPVPDPMPTNSDGGLALDGDPNAFPADLFHLITGYAATDWQAAKFFIKSEGHLLDDCTTLDTNSGERINKNDPDPIYWIDGNCNPGGDVGSYRFPVIVIVSPDYDGSADDQPIDCTSPPGGSISVNGNDELFGIFFSFEAPECPGTGGGVSLVGGPQFYGSVMSNHEIDLGAGAFTIRYLDNLFLNLEEAIKEPLVAIPGTYRHNLF